MWLKLQLKNGVVDNDDITDDDQPGDDGWLLGDDHGVTWCSLHGGCSKIGDHIRLTCGGDVGSVIYLTGCGENSDHSDHGYK